MLNRQRRMINARDTVTLSIGGQVFVTHRATLFRLPNSRLYMLAIRDAESLESGEEHEASSPTSPLTHTTATFTTTSSQSNTNNNPANQNTPAVYFFDRDPEIFRFVLDFYRTGELHLPASICGPFVRKELIFWGIEESYIQPCCMPAYMRYEEERRTKTTLFKDCFEDISSMQTLVHYCRGFKRWRYTLWLFLDYPSSSVLAKLWATVLLLLMIASVMSFCLSTHAAFRTPSLKALYVNKSSAFCNQVDMDRNPKIMQDCTTEPVRQLVYLDVVLNIIFTLEFLAKLFISPDKRKFLKTGIALLDIMILSSYWIYISLYYKYYYHYHPVADTDPPAMPLWVLNKLSMTQALRILRIFKISKISRGLRVLMLTIKKSITELVLLGFLLMNGIFCFSSLIYMAEYQVPDTMPNIVQSFWWAIITLTTVGYGDTFPKSGYGFIVGSLAAICGCVVTGLAIPIIGNNFNTYYKYMENQLKQDKYLMELRKDMDESAGALSNLLSDGTSKARRVKYPPHLHSKNKAERVMASMIKSAAIGMSNDLKSRNALVLMVKANNHRAAAATKDMKEASQLKMAQMPAASTASQSSEHQQHESSLSTTVTVDVLPVPNHATAPPLRALQETTEVASTTCSQRNSLGDVQKTNGVEPRRPSRDTNLNSEKNDATTPETVLCPTAEMPLKETLCDVSEASSLSTSSSGLLAARHLPGDYV